MTIISTEIDFIEMANDIACIKQSLLGNGQPGLCQRVNKLENTERNLGFLVGTCSGLGAAAGYMINTIINIFKGN